MIRAKSIVRLFRVYNAGTTIATELQSSGSTSLQTGWQQIEGSSIREGAVAKFRSSLAHTRSYASAKPSTAGTPGPLISGKGSNWPFVGVAGAATLALSLTVKANISEYLGWWFGTNKS